MALVRSKIQKFSWGACLQTPPGIFWLRALPLQISWLRRCLEHRSCGLCPVSGAHSSSTTHVIFILAGTGYLVRIDIDQFRFRPASTVLRTVTLEALSY